MVGTAMWPELGLWRSCEEKAKSEGSDVGPNVRDSGSQAEAGGNSVSREKMEGGGACE